MIEHSVWIKALAAHGKPTVTAMDILWFGFLLATAVFAQPPAENKACFQGNLKKAVECCPLPRMMNKTIADKCNQEFKNLSPRPPPGVRKTEGSCVTQCIFKEIGGYNETSKTLNVEAIRKAIMANTWNSKSFMPLIISSIDYCFPLVTKDPQFLATPVSPIPGRDGCSFLPPALMNCIKIELFKKCPKNKWTDIPECNHLKEKLATGCSYSSIING